MRNVSFDLVSMVLRVNLPYSPHLFLSQTAITYEEVRDPFNQKLLESFRARSLDSLVKSERVVQSSCSSSLRQGAPESWLGHLLLLFTALIYRGLPRVESHDSSSLSYLIFLRIEKIHGLLQDLNSWMVFRVKSLSDLHRFCKEISESGGLLFFLFPS